MFYLLKHLLLFILVIFKLKCNNLIFNEIMILNASYVYLYAFSLHQESPNLDPGRRTPHFCGGFVTNVVPLPLVEEEVVPLPLVVRAPWENNDNEEEEFASRIGKCIVVPLEEENVQFASGICTCTTYTILSIPPEEEEVEFASGIGTSTTNLWFKCPICLGDWYDRKSNVFFYIKNFIELEMWPLNVVEQHRQLARLLEEDKRLCL
jgi:hypothetical protein